MIPMPALFVSHGAPTIALWPEAASDAWRLLGPALGRPRAILVASAHWLSATPLLGSHPQPPTIHDFYGFPRPLYALNYPAPGAPEVAEQARQLLAAAGIEAALDSQRGLDHGSWVPLRELFPSADVPVLQLALQPQAGAAHHFALGAALAPLRERGVLIVGSGGLTHNLRAWMDGLGRDGTPAWVTDFAEWMAARAAAADVDSLLAYRTQAPHAVENHPTDEHLLPFFVALGAGGSAAAARRIFQSISQGVLSMDAYAFGETANVDSLARAAGNGAATVS